MSVVARKLFSKLTPQNSNIYRQKASRTTTTTTAFGCWSGPIFLLGKASKAYFYTTQCIIVVIIFGTLFCKEFCGDRIIRRPSSSGRIDRSTLFCVRFLSHVNCSKLWDRFWFWFCFLSINSRWCVVCLRRRVLEIPFCFVCAFFLLLLPLLFLQYWSSGNWWSHLKSLRGHDADDEEERTLLLLLARFWLVRRKRI